MVLSGHHAGRIGIRSALPGDLDFLLKVYRSVRQEEMASWGWTDAQRDVFVRMQFDLRRRAYQASFPGALENIVSKADTPAGSMLVFRSESEIRLVDVALLPEYRNCGIGSHLIGELVRESTDTGIPLRLSVVSGNPAMRLYQRLGFSATREQSPYLEMEYNGASTHHA
jgi:ribosomal protein S18 acetylase RimI-like enzyme